MNKNNCIDNKDNFTNLYYNFFIGEYPQSMIDYHKTNDLFNHLIDAGINEGELWSVISQLPSKERLSFLDMPSTLWDNSLLEKDKFYFHKELQVTPPPPSWDSNEDYNFYREMKIRYTLENALDYFVKVSGVRAEWVARDKEIGSIKYLLKEYKKFSFIEPIDFFLHLIDYCVANGNELNSIYDLRNEEIELAKVLEIDVLNAVAAKKNTIIWRNSCGI